MELRSKFERVELVVERDIQRWSQETMNYNATCKKSKRPYRSMGLLGRNGKTVDLDISTGSSDSSLWTDRGSPLKEYHSINRKSGCQPHLFGSQSGHNRSSTSNNKSSLIFPLIATQMYKEEGDVGL
jgi:hypothetical protein